MAQRLICCTSRAWPNWSASGEAWPLDDESTGAQLLAALGERYPQLAPASRLKLAVNQTHAKPTVVIRPGDEVAVFEPVTGG